LHGLTPAKMGHPPLRDAALIVNGNQNTADFFSALPAPIARPIGPNTALVFVLTIGPAARFRGSKKIANYLGLSPSEDSSGGKRRLGGHQQTGQHAADRNRASSRATRIPNCGRTTSASAAPITLSQRTNFIGYPPTHSFLLSISTGATLGTRFLLARQC
jgi:hypothetical protein